MFKFKNNYRVMIAVENIAKAIEVVNKVRISDLAVRNSVVEDLDGVERFVYILEFKASESEFEKFFNNVKGMRL